MSSVPIPGYPLRQRRFASLDPGQKGISDAPSLKGIIFDVDGTLWYPSLVTEEQVLNG